MARENQADAESKPTGDSGTRTREETQANANRGLPIKASRSDNPFTALDETAKEAEAVVGNAGRGLLAAQERGYHGFVPDPTPNDNYTVAGVTSGAPTPETSRKLRNEATARTVLPDDIPFLPKDQEQFEQAVEYRTKREQDESK